MSDVPLLAVTVNVHPCHGAPPLADDARWTSELRVWGGSLGKPKDILMVPGVMARGMIAGGSVPDVLTTGCLRELLVQGPSRASNGCLASARTPMDGARWSCHSWSGCNGRGVFVECVTQERPRGPWHDVRWLSMEIDVSAVADGDHQDEQDVVVDLVHDPVVAGAHTPLAVATDQLLGAVRTGFAGQQLKRCLDASLGSPVQLA